jgi:hypothetical protein
VGCCAVLAGRDKGEPNGNLGSVKINDCWSHCGPGVDSASNRNE